MTREEKIKILEEAQERAFEEIAQTSGKDMGSEEFTRLLGAAQSLEWMAQPHEARYPAVPVPEEGSAPDEGQIEEPKPEIVPEQVQTAPTMSKEEVRDKLSTYSNKYDSLDVASIMAEMGYGKLSDIPATRYCELLEKVEAAVKAGA